MAGQTWEWKITVSSVGQKRHDGFSFIFGTFLPAQWRPKPRRGGNADQHAFLPGDLTAGFKGGPAGYRNNLVINFSVQHLRNKPGADALKLV
mgnify:CR=1 FL=1